MTLPGAHVTPARVSKPAFLPYARQSIEQDDIDAVVAVLRSDWLTSGPSLERFENELARKVGAEHAVAVSNGTAALHAACHAVGVTEGDEVIVPAITFVATANCARYLGAEPVFADVDPNTGLISGESVERRKSARTRAVIPVHLTGSTVDLDAVRDAIGSEVRVIEDAAHALGATAGGDPVGSCRGSSDLAVFSFHPIKHITTAEGGAVSTNDAGRARRVRQFRDHGLSRDPTEWKHESPGPWYYEQHELGHNLRLSDLQAGLGVSQLSKLERFVDRRRHLAALYDSLIAEIAGVSPVTDSNRRSNSAYHLYSILVDFEERGVERRDVVHRMRDDGIGTQVHYLPLPMQPYYRGRGARLEDYPGAARYYARTLSLPMFPVMKDDDVERVVNALSAALDR